MSALLEAWYVDSSPGNRFSLLKCGEKAASFGISGSSTISTPIEGADITGAIPGRATVAPGTLITRGGGGAHNLGFNSELAVWFDGHSALYNLPKASDSTSFAMSFWYNQWHDHAGVGEDDGPGENGILYGSSTSLVSATDAAGNPSQDTRYFSVWPTNLSNGFDLDCKLASASKFIGLSYKKGFGVTTSPIDEMQGWCHVMLSVQKSGSDYKLTMWINDTEIVTNQTVSTETGAPSIPFSAPDYSDDSDHFWNIGGKPDRIRLAGSRIFVTNVFGNTTPRNAGDPMAGIGPVITQGLSYIASCVTDYHMTNMGAQGRYPTQANNNKPLAGTQLVGFLGCAVPPNMNADANLIFTVNGTGCGDISINADQWYWCSDYVPGHNKGFQPRDGEGFRGGVTELWIAPGQFIDWSVAANRYKFHNSDTGVGNPSSASIWAPCDIGSTGKTPTGTKPLIYLTGKNLDFNKNRAKNGAALTLYRNSSGGLVGFLKDYFSKPSQVA
jgi:hypothetical protein